jgi:hypothetical protein
VGRPTILGGLAEDWDAAKRISDTVNLHLVATTDPMENVRKWCVFALSDGATDNIVYDTKDDALRHTRHSKDHCYLQITPDGITQNDALRFLRINRHPMIDTTAPEHVTNRQIFPRFSNLSPATRRFMKNLAEVQAKNAGK